MRAAATATTLAFLGLAATTSMAFVRPSLPLVNTPTTRSSSISMSSVLPSSSIAQRELEAGTTAPFGATFDPLGLSNGKSLKDLKKWRESELKHGRVAMLAVLGAAIQENWHPLWGFNEKEMDGAIFHFQEIQNTHPYFWTALVLAIGLVEANSIGRVWDRDGVEVGGNTIAGVREEAITGDLGLDPLGIIRNDDVDKFLDYRNKELNNGRLAMIAAAGIAAQEKLLGGLPEFEIHRFLLSDIPEPAGTIPGAL